MSRVWFLLLLGASCLRVGVLRASCLDVEDAVRRDVLSQGLSLGYDDEAGTCLAVASAQRALPEEAPEAVCARTRNVCFRMAELRARHQIMSVVRMRATGSNAYARSSGRGRRSKAVEALFGTFAEGPVLGCRHAAFREERTNGFVCAAVALVWSRRLQERERCSRQGMCVPSPTWREELTGYVRTSSDGVTFPPAFVFEDAAGFVHHIGVGASVARDDSPLRGTAALRTAELFARANFQLLRDGDEAVRRQVRAWMADESGETAFRTTASVFESMGQISASGPLPIGACEVHLVRHPLPRGEGTLWISFFGL